MKHYQDNPLLNAIFCNIPISEELAPFLENAQFFTSFYKWRTDKPRECTWNKIVGKTHIETLYPFSLPVIFVEEIYMMSLQVKNSF